MKYIIEIENEPFMQNNDPVMPTGTNDLYRAKGFDSLVFDKKGLDKLTPYKEPDRQAIYSDAHETGYELGYKKGSEDAWEFCGKIADEASDHMFDNDYQPFDKTDQFDLTYQEAKAQYEKWKAEQEQIKVGDECLYQGDKCVVTFLYDKDYGVVMFDDGSGYEEVSTNILTKTGRHFTEIADLLEKMKEES